MSSQDARGCVFDESSGAEGDRRVTQSVVGGADAYSSVDVQCLVPDEVADELRASWMEVVEHITPTVQITPFSGTFGGTCITPGVAPTRSGVQRGVERSIRAPSKDGDALRSERPAPGCAGPPTAPSGRALLPVLAGGMFLYMLGASVVVLGRDEVLPGSNGVVMVCDVAFVGLLLAERGRLGTREHSAPNNAFPPCVSGSGWWPERGRGARRSCTGSSRSRP